MKNYTVHRLVATAFIENPEEKAEIDHINTIRTDNRVENLRWVTRSENFLNPLTRVRNSEARKGRENESSKRKVICLTIIPMTYDEAIKRIEQIVSELEQSDAVSMDTYQAKAKEAKKLLTFCQRQLTDWETKMNEVTQDAL
jgi:exodeoxyribonuclease VII small subunit